MSDNLLKHLIAECEANLKVASIVSSSDEAPVAE